MKVRLVAILADGSTAVPVELPADFAEILTATAAMYRVTGFEPPWIGYLAVHEDEPVGTCAFKCAPEDGKAEIAYFTFPEFENRGFATAMARQLVDMARAAVPSIVVTAQTLPVRNFSNRILERLGFKQVGTAVDADAGEVWEWQLAKEEP
jgi:RimJ/RimL family protein N-acetyltransferase